MTRCCLLAAVRYPKSIGFEQRRRPDHGSPQAKSLIAGNQLVDPFEDIAEAVWRVDAPDLVVPVKGYVAAAQPGRQNCGDSMAVMAAKLTLH